MLALCVCIHLEIFVEKIKENTPLAENNDVAKKNTDEVFQSRPFYCIMKLKYRVTRIYDILR